MPRYLIRAVLLGAALHAASARADPEFSFGGFGTLGIVHSSDRQADFTGSPSKPFGAGYSRTWSAEVDTLIAGQVSATFTPRISAVLQVVSEQNYDHSFRPHVEWANVKYLVTPDFAVRLGRTVLPVLMLTESGSVGYANPWVRPPVEVYNLVTVTHNDGVDVSYRTAVATGTHTLQLTAGGSDSKFPRTTAKVRDVVVIANTFEQGPLTARMSLGRAKITLPALDPLWDGFRQFGPAGAAIADRFALHDHLVTFGSVGTAYDPGPWFVTGEGVMLRGRATLGTQTAWYVSGGHRFGRLTPFATYARSRSSLLSDPGLPVSNLPPALAGAATGLNAALNSTLARNVSQGTLSVGARWELGRHAALKLQFARTRIGAGSIGAFTNIQPGRGSGGQVDKISATVDFVF